MEKHVNLNKLLDQPYLEWKAFNRLVNQVDKEKQLFCSYHEGEESFHLAFMLIKLSSGIALDFVNCDLNYESFFKLVNNNSTDIEDFLINYLINQINKLHSNGSEVYTYSLDYPGLFNYLSPSYVYNKNLNFILRAINNTAESTFLNDSAISH